MMIDNIRELVKEIEEAGKTDDSMRKHLAFCALTDAITDYHKAVFDAGYEMGERHQKSKEKLTPIDDQEIFELLPIVQSGWSMSDYGRWVARAVERAHGIVFSR